MRVAGYQKEHWNNVRIMTFFLVNRTILLIKVMTLKHLF